MTRQFSCSATVMKVICWRWPGAGAAVAAVAGRQTDAARVEEAVNDAAHFTPFHWVDALLAGKSKRALHILRQLQRDSEVVILLRTLQRDLLTLLQLQRQQAKRLRAHADGSTAYLAEPPCPVH